MMNHQFVAYTAKKKQILVWYVNHANTQFAQNVEKTRYIFDLIIKLSKLIKKLIKNHKLVNFTFFLGVLCLLLSLAPFYLSFIAFTYFYFYLRLISVIYIMWSGLS
jgi:hypothetical protein